MTMGPVLSPHALLCETCFPSQYGKVLDLKQRQSETTPLSCTVCRSSAALRIETALDGLSGGMVLATPAPKDIPETHSTGP